MNFQVTLASWHDFYSMTGMAAATLVGLLFVGLSLHLRVVVTRADVKALARVTLASLGLMLVLSLFMVVPEGNDPSTSGWDLVGTGIAGCLIIARSVVSGMRGSHRTLSFPRLVLRFGLTTMSFLAVIAVGGVLVAGDYHGALTWLVAIAIFLLVSALRNSWDLLVSVGAATGYSAHHPETG
jgi:hypothetical protein